MNAKTKTQRKIELLEMTFTSDGAAKIIGLANNVGEYKGRAWDVVDEVRLAELIRAVLDYEYPGDDTVTSTVA